MPQEAGHESMPPEGGARRVRPRRVTPAAVDPQLGLLPTDQIEHWEDFEDLLRVVAREVEGLRDVQLYGNRGQGQYGLDAVGYTAEGEPVGIQGKKYEKFTVADLVAAVKKYTDHAKKMAKDGNCPGVLVNCLIIGVSCRAADTKVVKRLGELNVTHKPLHIEIWDQRRLGDFLRNRPDIVTDFFGPQTAASFCRPVSPPHVVPPSAPERADFADAVIRGPEKASPAAIPLDKAAQLLGTDPLVLQQEIRFRVL